jgi:colicin import membrane protein
MNQIQEYTQTEAALATLTEKYAEQVYEVSTTAGMATAKAARAELRGYRTTLERKRVELKAPALERSRLIDSEAKRITAEIVKLESPIDDQIKAEEARKDAERAARAAADAARISAIIGMVAEIKAIPLLASGKTSDEIAFLIASTDITVLDESVYQEFWATAQEAKTEALRGLTVAYDNTLTQETEATRIATEQQESARLAKIEADKLAQEQELLAKEREAFNKERAAAAAMDAERNRLADEADAAAKALADLKAAEAKRIADLEAAKAAEEARIAAIAAKAKQETAEAKAKLAEKERKLSEAKCATATDALRKILALCQDTNIQDYEALIQIALIAEGNL